MEGRPLLDRVETDTTSPLRRMLIYGRDGINQHGC